ncbi:hypothetical protein EDB92DRAFT_128349 [Lactarius akahatsu]|uniref:Uncharacterized protein n=1 Tax=Lactarius akahatsu TaxID=416441 RepID=A0AAD4LBQ4_9AGAM|nr:hypothetical protein EDB92DRAFT_128349 [Lactarius akahatsu]
MILTRRHTVVLFHHLTDLGCGVGPLHVNVKMEGQLSTSKLTPGYQLGLVFRLSGCQRVGPGQHRFSLVDQNPILFQTAYPLLISMVWLALAGNTGFVAYLPEAYNMLQVEETIKMERDPSLFDHPRRCFIYLFPSRRTWFLLTIRVILK